MDKFLKKIVFVLNGEEVSVSCRPEAPLIWILRDELGQKTVRYGCGQEQCGSCTIIKDGIACYSCTLRTEDISGSQIETTEGLVKGDENHPLVDAFEEFQAGQCGYCIPGILMRTKAHFDSGKPTNHESLVEFLDKHLCRCGSHIRIIKAIKKVADLQVL